MAPVLNEQSRRRFVALEARQLGRGGVSLMARISGLARSTIYHGLSDLPDKGSARLWRIRKTGRGRKKKKQPRASDSTRRGIDRLIYGQALSRTLSAQTPTG